MGHRDENGIVISSSVRFGCGWVKKSSKRTRGMRMAEWVHELGDDIEVFTKCKDHKNR